MKRWREVACVDNPQLQRIEDNLKKLKLVRTGQKLESLLQEAGKNDLSYTDFLDRLLEEEVALKYEKHIALNTTWRNYPTSKH